MKLFAGGVFGRGVAVGLEGKPPAAQGIRIYGIDGLERQGPKINLKKKFHASRIQLPSSTWFP